MERVDMFHRTQQENVNILFNMIQACRIDCEILRNSIIGKDRILDSDMVGITQALLSLIRNTFQTLGEFEEERDKRKTDNKIINKE